MGPFILQIMSKITEFTSECLLKFKQTFFPALDYSFSQKYKSKTTLSQLTEHKNFYNLFETAIIRGQEWAT